MQKLLEILETTHTKIEKERQIERDKILMATSICSDELNNTRHLTTLNQNVFKLGGLGGYPYAGITGMNAYLDHVPDHGAALIIYGPHIGLNNEGTYGIVHRYGQNRETVSCGALQGILSEFESNNVKKQALFDVHNIQFDFLKQRILQENYYIAGQNFHTFTQNFFTIIDDALNAIIQKSNLKNYAFPLYTVGGIIINKEDGNYFEVLKNEVFE